MFANIQASLTGFIDSLRQIFSMHYSGIVQGVYFPAFSADCRLPVAGFVADNLDGLEQASGFAFLAPGAGVLVAYH
jgi:hypothetical protein